MATSPGVAGEREAWNMDMMAARDGDAGMDSVHGGTQRRILGSMLVRRPLKDIRLEYVRFYMVRLPYSVEARIFPFRRHATEGVMIVIVNALYGCCAVKDRIFSLACRADIFGKERIERAGSPEVRGGFRNTHRCACAVVQRSLLRSLLSFRTGWPLTVARRRKAPISAVRPTG